MCVFFLLFVHNLFYKFIDSIDLKWCIGHLFTHPVIKKMVLTSQKNIIATSSAKLFSAVLYRALACTGVLCRALICRTQVLDNRNPLPDNRTQIT